MSNPNINKINKKFLEKFLTSSSEENKVGEENLNNYSQTLVNSQINSETSNNLVEMDKITPNAQFKTFKKQMKSLPKFNVRKISPAVKRESNSSSRKNSFQKSETKNSVTQKIIKAPTHGIKSLSEVSKLQFLLTENTYKPHLEIKKEEKPKISMAEVKNINNKYIL